MIPYGRQSINQSDIDAVIGVLQSDFLTQGPAVPRFEASVAESCGAKYGIAVNSGTSALHLACVALGIGCGDRVWTSPITFVASANCARYCGAEIDFIDIHPRTYNLSPVALEEELIRAEADGELPKAVIPVHLAGQSCDMAEIHALGQRYGFHIIEDASHAIGASYRGKPVGCCKFSDITVFSFHPVKIITTGEGGMALTNDDELSAKLEILRSHGITRDTALMGRRPDGPWYYEQIDLGFNYRMTDIQAALGLSQMHRLEEFVEERRAIAARYDSAFESLELVTPWVSGDRESAYHLYIIRLNTATDPVRHRESFEALLERGIGVNLHYIPVYRQPDFQRTFGEYERLPEAEAYYSTAMSLPMFPGLSEKEQDYIVQTVTSLVSP